VKSEARGDGASARERSAPGGRSVSAVQSRATLPRMAHDGDEERGDVISSRRRHAGRPVVGRAGEVWSRLGFGWVAAAA
jgi:hypothetical protein